jgi:flotillin
MITNSYHLDEAAENDVKAKLYRQAQDAEGRLIAAQKEAEGRFIQQQKEAEGRLIAAQKEAEGRLVQQAKEAEGMTKMAEAYGKMAQAFGGPQGLIQYLMIKEGVYGELARANAQAVQGMQPKMTVWNTGSTGGDARENDSDPGAAIRNTYQMLPPLMSTIHEQTGMTLPAWQFGKLGAQVGEIQTESISSSCD